PPRRSSRRRPNRPVPRCRRGGASSAICTTSTCADDVAKKAKDKKGGRTRKLIDDVSRQQQEMTVALESLRTSVHELPDLESMRVLQEIRRLLDDVLVAQHRTNQLLELALRAGFDD